MYKLIATLSVIGMVLGYGVWFLGSFLCYGWYNGWLAENFMWRLVASVVAMVTFPLMPLAIIIEWLWHGWPRELTVIFAMIVGGVLAGWISGAVHEWAENRIEARA